jgi:ATP dependent DNA ligase domain
MARPVAGRPGAEIAGLPEWIRPQLTQLVDQAPDGPQWLHEIKFDGYRMHARLDRGAVRLLTRTGLDWTHKYPAIAAAVSSLDARQAYLDGELCGLFPDGITSFSVIQLASESGNAAALVFFLFDLLYLDGEKPSARDLFRSGRSAFAFCYPAVAQIATEYTGAIPPTHRLPGTPNAARRYLRGLPYADCGAGWLCAGNRRRPDMLPFIMGAKKNVGPSPTPVGCRGLVQGGRESQASPIRRRLARAASSPPVHWFRSTSRRSGRGGLLQRYCGRGLALARAPMRGSYQVGLPLRSHWPTTGAGISSAMRGLARQSHPSAPHSPGKGSTPKRRR